MSDKCLLILLVFLFGLLNIGVLLLMLQAFKFNQADLFKISITSLALVLVNYVAWQAFSEDDMDG